MGFLSFVGERKIIEDDRMVREEVMLVTKALPRVGVFDY